jgi:two-component sensor histidine kinase
MILRLRSALTGSDAFSLATWVLLIPWTYAIALSFRTTPTSSAWVLIFAPIIAHTTGGLFLWLGSWLQPATPQYLRLALTASSFLLYGFVRAITLAAIRTIDNPAFTISSRSLIPGAVVSITWLIIATYMVHYGRQNIRTIEELETKRRKLVFESSVLNQQINWVKNELPLEINNRVNTALQEFNSNFNAARAKSNSHSPLNTLLNDYLRPLSRQLKDSRIQVATDIRRYPTQILANIREFTQSLTLGQPFAPLTAAVTATATGIPPIVIYSDFIGVLYAALVIPPGVIIIVISTRKLYDLVKKHLPTWARIILLLTLWTFPGFLLGIVFLANPATRAAFQFLPFTSSALTMVSGLAIAIYFTAIEQRDQIVQTITRENKAALHAKEISRQKLKISESRLIHLIHGRLQGQLNALAVHASRGDSYDVNATLQEIESTLSQLLNDSDNATNFNRALDTLIKMWSRVCDVNVRVSESAMRVLDSQPAAASATIEVVREIINNSIKHGQPTWISLVITSQADPAVIITMTNDGQLVTPSQSGVGTEILNDFCIKWDIKKIKAGTRLNAKIVCE